jgi:hypothetical protein
VAADTSGFGVFPRASADLPQQGLGGVVVRLGQRVLDQDADRRRGDRGDLLGLGRGGFRLHLGDGDPLRGEAGGERVGGQPGGVRAASP